MSIYKSDLDEFAENRLYTFSNESQQDSAPIILDENFKSAEIDQAVIEKIMNEISSCCTNPPDLETALSKVIQLNNINLYYMIVQSSFFPTIINTLKKSPTPSLIQYVCDLTHFSPILTYNLYHLDFINILFSNVFSFNLDISQKSLEFIRKIIPYGILNRVVLFFNGFFDMIIKYIQNPNYSSLFEYALHTAFLFVYYDPVYGENSYSKIGKKLPKRTEIRDQCKSLNFTQKVLFKVSLLLKNGLGSCPNNKSMYDLINILLLSGDEKISFHGLLMLEFLSIYSQENSMKIIESTQFLNFAKAHMAIPSQNQVSIFNIIRNLIYFTGYSYEKKFIDLNPFFLGLDVICDSSAPSKLRVAAGRCIFYGIKNIDFIHKTFSSPKIFKSLLQVFQNSDISVRSEVCCLLVSILFKCNVVQLNKFMSDELIYSFLDFIEDYDDELTIIILLLLKHLFENCPEMFGVFNDEDAVEVLHRLAENQNDKISEIANELIRIATIPIGDNKGVDEDENEDDGWS